MQNEPVIKILSEELDRARLKARELVSLMRELPDNATEAQVIETTRITNEYARVKQEIQNLERHLNNYMSTMKVVSSRFVSGLEKEYAIANEQAESIRVKLAAMITVEPSFYGEIRNLLDTGKQSEAIEKLSARCVSHPIEADGCEIMMKKIKETLAFELLPVDIHTSVSYIDTGKFKFAETFTLEQLLDKTNPDIFKDATLPVDVITSYQVVSEYPLDIRTNLCKASAVYVRRYLSNTAFVNMGLVFVRVTEPVVEDEPSINGHIHGKSNTKPTIFRINK